MKLKNVRSSEILSASYNYCNIHEILPMSISLKVSLSTAKCKLSDSCAKTITFVQEVKLILVSLSFYIFN